MLFLNLLVWNLKISLAYDVVFPGIGDGGIDAIVGPYQGELYCQLTPTTEEGVLCSLASSNFSENVVGEVLPCSASNRDVCTVGELQLLVGSNVEQEYTNTPHILGLQFNLRDTNDPLLDTGPINTNGERYIEGWKFTDKDFRAGLNWKALETIYTESLPFESPEVHKLTAPRFLYYSLTEIEFFDVGQNTTFTFPLLHGVHCYDEVQAYSDDTMVRYCCEIFNPQVGISGLKIPLNNLRVQRKCVDLPLRSLTPNEPGLLNDDCGYLSSSIAFCASTGTYSTILEGGNTERTRFKIDGISELDNDAFGCTYHCRFPCVTQALVLMRDCKINTGLGLPAFGSTENQLSSREAANIDLSQPLNSIHCQGVSNVQERHGDFRKAVCAHDMRKDPTFAFGCEDRDAIPIARPSDNPGGVCRRGQFGCTRGECRCLNGCSQSFFCNGRGTLWQDLKEDKSYCDCEEGYLGDLCQYEDVQNQESRDCHKGQPLTPLEYQTGP